MAPRKKRKADSSHDGLIMPFAPDDGAIRIELPGDEEGNALSVDPVSGNVEVEHDDGSVTVDLTGNGLTADIDTSDVDHGDNLAEKIDATELGRIAEELLDAIASDKQGRSQWENMRAKTIELLGLKLEDPKSNVTTSSAGMATSVVRDPTLLEAVEFFRANAYSEMCPATGPVKVVNWSNGQTRVDNDLAETLQTDLNYYLTTTASEYYPDTYYMLWWTGLASGTFKKVYKCPLRRRPVSEYVDGKDLIVPTTATDLKNAGRITHEVNLRPAQFRRMQIAGVYRDVDVSDPMQATVSPVDQKIANVDGTAAQTQRIEDQEYTIYECYCELDIKGFEHEEKGTPSGLPLPYRVTIEEGSRQILEIRKNWDEDDEDMQAQIPFVLFPFSTGLSRIYGSGLGQMMGNMVSALTALLRISIDAGIASNYPGMIKAKGTGRQLQNEIIVPPGGVMEIDIGNSARIQDAIMGMPYKDVSPAVAALMEQLRGVAKQLGGTANLPLGEGRQDAPVGTTLALLEQATKPASATHKVLHASQAEEFRLLLNLFKDDPEALWRGNKRPAMGATKEERIAKFMAAVENCDIQPMSDPNVPSELHRKLMAMGLKQITAGNPAYNQVEVDRYISSAVFKLADADFNKFLAPPGPGPQPDPAIMAKLQIDKQNADTKALQVQLQAKGQQDDRALKENIETAKLAISHSNANKPSEQQQVDPLQARALDLKHMQIQQAGSKMAVDADNAKADRQSREAIEAMKIASVVGVHPESDALVDEQLQQMSAFLAPAADGKADGGEVEAKQDDAGPVVLTPEESHALRIAALSQYLSAYQSGTTH